MVTIIFWSKTAMYVSSMQFLKNRLSKQKKNYVKCMEIGNYKDYNAYIQYSKIKCECLKHLLHADIGLLKICKLLGFVMWDIFDVVPNFYDELEVYILSDHGYFPIGLGYRRQTYITRQLPGQFKPTFFFQLSGTSGLQL